MRSYWSGSKLYPRFRSLSFRFSLIPRPPSLLLMPPKEPISADDLHHLVLLYLSVAYEADHSFDPSEQHTILRLVRQWMPSLAPAEANGVVATALTALQSGMTGPPETLARAVGTGLTPALRRRVLADLGRVARADGFLTVQEARVIRRVRTALAIKDPDDADAQ